MVSSNGAFRSSLTISQRPASQPSFSPVKVPVAHKPLAGSLSQTPFMISSVPSGQASPASGPDRTQTQAATTSSVDMVSPLDNLYQESDPEPVSASYEHSVDPLPASIQNITPPDQVEEGELSELEDQPEQDNTDSGCAISEDQNYHETVRGVRAFMGWSHIPHLQYTPATRVGNLWIGHRAQPVGKVSVLLPPEDWLCEKLENLNLVLIEGYPSKSSEPGGLHMDQYLRPPKYQSRWYGIHPAEPKDITRPGRYVTTWPNDAAKLNSTNSKNSQTLCYFLSASISSYCSRYPQEMGKGD